MADFRIEFHHRGGPGAAARILPDLHAAIFTIVRLGIEALTDDLRAGGALSLAVLESQAGGPAPELPDDFRRVLGALGHLVFALNDLSEKSPVPGLAG